ncbi:hypothetical protein Tco_1182913 [Tanacetum coccineum]
MPTPPPSPPISLSPPSAVERLARCMAPSAHSSPPHVPSPLIPSSRCLTQIQTLGIASTQALVDAVTTALPSPPLPPSLYIPPPADRRDDIPESERPPRKRSCLFALVSRYEVGESSTANPPEVEGRLLFCQTLRLKRDDKGIRRGWETVLIVEEEAYASREAWAYLIGLSQAVHHEIQTHRDHVYAYEAQIQAHQTQLQLQGTLIQTQHQVHETRSQMQQAKMADLRETNHKHKGQMVEILRVMRDMRREMSDMHAEVLALQGQQRARQPGPDARIPDDQDASGDADSHI